MHKVIEQNNNLIIKDIFCFNIENTFESGQCFRWNKNDDRYIGVVGNRVCEISQKDNKIIFYNTTMNDYENFVKVYFGFDEDYESIIKEIETDAWIVNAIKEVNGIRLLKQDKWEVIASFIISANNNIPRIKKIIEKLCEYKGNKIEYAGNIYYTFPTPEQLRDVSMEEYKKLGFGYRDSYMEITVRDILEGKFNIEKISEMSTEDAKKALLKLKGVGPKVADCILLFAYSRYEVCPQDVWVKRLFQKRYNIENFDIKKGYSFAEEKWGKYAGIAQQYLFMYERVIASKEMV